MASTILTGRTLAFFVLLQSLAWTLMPTLGVQSLPLDVIEGIAWGQEWALGYYKHPPLPSWLTVVFFDLFGHFGVFLLSQLAIALTLFFVFRTGCLLFDEQRAVLGTLLLYGIYYFSWPTPEFNHNIAQMPAWAAFSYFLLQAKRTDAMKFWVGAGMAAGLGMMSKYSSVLIITAGGLFLLLDHEGRGRLGSVRPWSGLAVAAVIFAPHLYWLVINDFPTISYMLERSAEKTVGVGDRILQPLDFLGTQLANHAPALVVLLAAGFFHRVDFEKAPTQRSDAFRFLLVMGLAPALLTVLGSVVTGAGLQSMWGTPMWNFSGLLLVSVFSSQALQLRGRRVVIGLAVLLVIVTAGKFWELRLKDAMKQKHTRTGWPAQEIADTAERIWAGHYACPLEIVAGDYWLTGLVSSYGSSRASTFIDGDPARSAWISDERLNRQGALVLWLESQGEPDEEKRVLARFAPESWAASGVETIPWTRTPELPPLQLRWALLAPAAPDCAGGQLAVPE